jgi:hypothetical protein
VSDEERSTYQCTGRVGESEADQRERTNEGAMQLEMILYLEPSMERVRVRPRIAALAVE